MNKETQHIDISLTTESILRVVFIILGAWFLYIVRDVLVILLFSIIIAAAVSPAADFLQKRGISRTLGVFLVYLLAILIIAGILYLIVSPLAAEFDNLALVAPVYFDRINSFFKIIRDNVPQYEQILDGIQKRLNQTSDGLSHASDNVFGATSSLFGGIVSAVFVVVISFYLAAREHGISQFLRAVTPREKQSYVLGLWLRAQRKLGRWLQVQIAISFIVGFLVFIGLWIFGIPHKLLLALIAAVLEIIPFFGPVIAAIPAILFGLLKSPVVALWIILVYTIVHQLENHVIVPNIMNKAIGLNPVIVIIALLIGGELYGIPGIILAVPTAVVLVEIIKDFGHHHEEDMV